MEQSQQNLDEWMQVLHKESTVLFGVDLVCSIQKYIMTLMINDAGNGGQ